MYSFYGGQKGKDFRIHTIFPNRSEGLLKDLQARWYSPVNVGDYVFISYGNIADQDTYIVNKNGVSDEVKSAYSRNLDIDLFHCGKSYNNSLWQKIYVDENNKVSPDFPDSENNTFVFVNFNEDDLNGELKGTIDLYGDQIRQNTETQKWEYWDTEAQKWIIIDDNFKVPGYSLRETSTIYAEENFGFGYRLIACLTGQTPRIQVYHQTIDIEDGDPYVTLDLSNLEKPKIKFYLQRAQTINEFVSNIVLDPLSYPEASIITEGDCSNIRFNPGDIIPSQFQSQIDKYEKQDLENLELSDNERFKMENYAIKLADGKGWLVKSRMPYRISFAVQASLSHPVLQFELPRAVKFYNGYLFGQGRLGDYPFYIAMERQWSRQQKYTISYKQIACLEDIANGVLAGINKSNLVYYKYNRLQVAEFKEQFIRQASFNTNLLPYFKNDISLIDYLMNITEDNYKSEEIPWNIYGIEESNKKSDETYVSFLNSIGNALNEQAKTIKEYKETNPSELKESLLKSLSWGRYGLMLKSAYDSLLNDEERESYLDMYYDGLTNPGSFIPLLSLIHFYTPLLDYKKTIYEILTCEEEYYYFKPTLGNFFQSLTLNFTWMRNHYDYVLSEVMPGDIYIHVPTGRLYQFTDVYINEGAENSSMTALYLGALTAPAPEIEQTLQPTFIKDDEENYIHNQINIRDNLLIASNNEGQREQYIFDLPKAAEFQTQKTVIINEEEPNVTTTIVQNPKDENDGIYNINFSLPRAIHMYSDEYKPDLIEGFITEGEGSPFLKDNYNSNNEQLSKGDIYIYTAYVETRNGVPQYNCLDPYRGYVYFYNGDGTWTRQGSILGPVGAPKSTKTITFVRDENLAKGEVVRVPETGELQYYKYSWYDEINEIINQYQLEDGYPNSMFGEAYVFQTGIQTDTGISIQESWWGQYYDDNLENLNHQEPGWSMTLLTGGLVLLDEYEDNENIIKNNTYTARYLNEVIPCWDTDNYY